MTIALTMSGTLVRDPELRFGNSGIPNCTFTLAHNNQRYDKQAGKWIDADVIFMRCVAWRTLAEQVAESFGKGDDLLVTGKLRNNTWETKEGEKREQLELIVDDVAGSARRAVVKVRRASRQQSPAAASAPPAASEPLDPWASSRSQAAGFADEPPF